jgi:hemerythrin superfamily protein
MPTTRGQAGSAKRATPARSTRSRSGASPRQRDAIAILRADHKLVDELFEQYAGAKSESRKQTLVDRICRELTVHTTVEEEIFYPAVRAALKDKDLMDEADVEHASAKELIKQLEAGKPGADHFDAKVTVLGEYIRHHVKEEQTEMFPRAHKTKLDMMELGAQIETRKAELMGQMQPAEKPASKSRSSILSLLSLG